MARRTYVEVSRIVGLMCVEFCDIYENLRRARKRFARDEKLSRRKGLQLIYPLLQTPDASCSASRSLHRFTLDWIAAPICAAWRIWFTALATRLFQGDGSQPARAIVDVVQDSTKTGTR